MSRPLAARLAWLAIPLALANLGATCQGRFVSAVPAVTGLTAPIFVAAPPFDGRLFVVERAGLVRIANPATGVVQPTPFLDIRSRTTSVGEAGLLSIAFDPNFGGNGRFYAYFVEIGTLDSVIARYTLARPTDGAASAASEQIILRVDQPIATNHKGGTIAFSPRDGYLYFALGDGGNGGNPAQDGNSLLGKMVRLDVSSGSSGYRIPPTNPFVSNPDVRDEIWSLGFRNPFRFSFDPDDGSLWIADVGEDELEEINYEPAGMGGRNYGWPVHEGTRCFQSGAPGGPCESPTEPAKFRFPVSQYSHDDGCSVTGGSPYRGGGALWQGSYFFADFCSKRFYSLLPGFRRIEITQQLAASGAVFAGPVAIAPDGYGELYVVNLSGGRIHYLDLGAPE